MKHVDDKNWGWLILFTSSATLLCCALPILLVSLGMGAVVASLYGKYLPFLRWFGLHEHITFSVTAIILIIAAWALYRHGRYCPTDPALAKKCSSAHKWNQRFLWTSIIFWIVGFISAYILPLFV